MNIDLKPTEKQIHLARAISRHIGQKLTKNSRNQTSLHGIAQVLQLLTIQSAQT